MRSLCKLSLQKGLTLCQKEIPDFKHHEVLIRIHKTGICGTDLQLYHSNDWACSVMNIPLTIGHEFVGRVYKVGSKVKSVKKGDWVSAEGHLFCGICDACLNNQAHFCINSKGIGVHTHGAMTDYFVMPESNLWLCNGLDSDIMAFADVLGNAVYALSKVLVKNKLVCITGAGPLGLSVLMLCKFLGAGFVSICDTNDYRLHLASKLGADETLLMDSNTLKKGFDFKKKWDVGFELSGKANALRSLISHLNPGSSLVLMGLLPKRSMINWQTLIFKNIDIFCLYGRLIFDTWKQLNDYLLQGFNPKPIITHHFDANDFEKAFQLMQSRQCGKILLHWNH